MSELKYNEPAERFAPIVEKSLCAGATAVMIPSETGCWVHYVEYCERIAAVKSEADKVIAEKDEKIDELKEHIDELQKATDSAWSKVNAMYDELRHHKYKRCLAMAKWCRMHDEFTQLESERIGLPQRTLFFEYRKKAMWWNKWHKRWLELAEKLQSVKCM